MCSTAQRPNWRSGPVLRKPGVESGAVWSGVDGMNIRGFVLHFSVVNVPDVVI